MDHTTPRAAIVSALAALVTPVPVCDDEPDTVTQTTIVVAWMQTVVVDAGWQHVYDVRIILMSLDAAGLNQRDTLTKTVVQWAHDTPLVSKRAGATRATATVGQVQYPAVVVTTNIIEPKA